MNKYKIKSNIAYIGIDMPMGSTNIETAVELNARDRESRVVVFDAMKAAGMLPHEAEIVESIWLSDGKVNFVSKYSYWKNGVIAFWEKV